MALLAAATPLGLAAYILLGGGQLYYPRNLTASLPALAVLAGVLTAAPRPPLRWGVAGLVIGACVVASGRSMDERYQRPPYEEMAHFIDATGSPGDAVISVFINDDVSPLALYSDQRYRTPETLDDSEAWMAARHGHSVFLWLFEPSTGKQVPPPSAGPDGSSTRFGMDEAIPASCAYTWVATAAVSAAGLESARRTSLRSPRAGRSPSARARRRALSRRLRSTRKAASSYRGWAIADRVMAFASGRLVAMGQPSEERADVSATHGAGARFSGFRLTPAGKRLDSEDIRVFAVTDGLATELERTHGE